MGKKALKKRIMSLLARIQEHEQKTFDEKKKAHPDQGLIRHWELEIAAFQANIDRAKKRL
jgi:hypothetical protein